MLSRKRQGPIFIGSARAWIDHGEELRRHTPVKAAIVNIKEDLEELICCPSLAALEHVTHRQGTRPTVLATAFARVYNPLSP